MDHRWGESSASGNLKPHVWYVKTIREFNKTSILDISLPWNTLHLTRERLSLPQADLPRTTHPALQPINVTP
jgi:hypothetical protein